MAERRMFAKTIVTSDAFLDMPMSARCLYFTLGVFADDDGFVNNPKAIMRQSGAGDDDLKVLIAKNFVLLFENGVIVIKHWRIHNYIQKDRYHPTKYQEQKALLTLDENGAYTMDTPCIQLVSEVDTEVRLGKDRLGKDSLEEDKSKKKRFAPPTLEELQSFITENNFTVDPQQFIDYYSSNGWMVGKTHMKDWKATVRNWQRREKERYPRRKPTRVVDLPDWYNANPQRTEEGDKASTEEVQAMRELLARGKHGAEN